jgi:hypothetical protein
MSASIKEGEGMSVKNKYWKRHKQLRATLAAHSLLIEIRHRGTPTTGMVM